MLMSVRKHLLEVPVVKVCARRTERDCVLESVCMLVPVLAILDALTQCGSVTQRRVPTATGTSGKDAILKEQSKQRNFFLISETTHNQKTKSAATNSIFFYNYKFITSSP